MNKFLLLFVLLTIPTFIYSQEIGKDIPLFSGKTANGESVSISDYKGKVTVVDFWASWCRPCKEEFPFLIELNNNYSEKGFAFLAVNLDEEIANMNNFLKKYSKDINFKIITDPDSKIANQFNIEAIPSTFVLDKKGVLRYMHVGFSPGDKEKFKTEIETLLSE